ncbi:MAG: hypothetical protein GXP03_08535 [Alphaproteobacteria bacterium]|nr:hypothetical protein [Alphaproteobacteria bacterium]
MVGISILRIGLFQIFGSGIAVLRICGALFLVILAARLSLSFLISGGDSYDAGGTRYEMLQTAPFGAYAILLALKLVASLWIAIAWHKFTLNKKIPNSYTPQWPGLNAIGRYFLLLSLLGLLTIVVAIPVFLVLQFLFYIYWVFASTFPLLWIEPKVIQFVFLSLFPALFLSFRYSLVLPATAIDQEFSLHASWKSTKHMTSKLWAIPTIIGSAFLVYTVVGPSIVGEWWAIIWSSISYVFLLIWSVGVVSIVYQQLNKNE